MADGYTTTNNVSMRFGFKDDRNKDMTISYSGTKSGITTAVMAEVAKALIDNKEAFKQAPTTLTSVKKVTTETKDYELDEIESMMV